MIHLVVLLIFGVAAGQESKNTYDAVAGRLIIVVLVLSSPARSFCCSRSAGRILHDRIRPIWSDGSSRA